MIKQPKHIDFSTTGRQPTDEEFKVVTEWIKTRKLRSTKLRHRRTVKRKSSVTN